MNIKISFLTIGDFKYFSTIIISARQVKKYYPESTFFIYDWGINEKQKEELTKIGNVSFIYLTKTEVNSELKISNYFIIKENLKLLRNFKKPTFLKNQMIKESNFMNKLICINNFAGKSKEPFIYLDADAFLIKDINEIVESNEFDVGFTIRRESELSLATNNCKLLNTGVIFFLGSKEKRVLLTKGWLCHALETNELIREQTSISRLLFKNKEDLDRDNFKLFGCRVKIFSCEIYNYNWIEKFITDREKSKVKILHFKSGRNLGVILDIISKYLNI